MKVRFARLRLPVLLAAVTMTVLIALPSSALAVTSAEKQAEADTARAQLDQYQSDLN